MNTKHIILFCLTLYYIPKVISYDAFVVEIMKRFDELKKENEEYVTFAGLRKIYEFHEMDQLEYVLDNYGVEITGENGYRERRVYYDKFQKAMREGLIHKYKIDDMTRYFFGTRDYNAPRGYINRRDLVRLHYPTYMTETQIDFVMTTYGHDGPDGRRLSFHGYRRAINTLSIPYWL
ncbi:uncharacterized protein LOC126834764 [Adelges cooleyi]|uniref:uncharacterized protein LOC126834764 n=1 Tax=Adelges cooleyi TaxID=133065 RepID=UPI00217FCE46|nr:uncharacterized protein LOC126834764 [Adelges cooleyi]